MSGKSCRKGIRIVELIEMFPNDEADEKWFEKERWGKDGTHCADCGLDRYSVVKSKKPMPYRCKDCWHHFSVRKGTVMQSSKLGYQKWGIAVYMVATSLKGVFSLRLHRDLKIRQPSAWHLAQRIRKGFVGGSKLQGVVEVDETYIGGKRKNMRNAKRKELKDTGRGGVGKTVVVGARERGGKVITRPIQDTTCRTLAGFVAVSVQSSATVYIDEHGGYLARKGREYHHESVKHSVSEYVNGMAHTNGIWSFWALLKRGYHGTYHHMSETHLARYVQEFVGCLNIREMDTHVQMSETVKGMVGKQLRYKDLVS